MARRQLTPARCWCQSGWLVLRVECPSNAWISTRSLRPGSFDGFEVLALGFPEIDDLALPASLRVEPPGAGDRSGNQDAEFDQLLDGPMDGLLVHPERLGDFGLRHANDVVEIQAGVEVYEDPIDL